MKPYCRHFFDIKLKNLKVLPQISVQIAQLKESMELFVTLTNNLSTTVRKFLYGMTGIKGKNLYCNILTTK